MNVRNEIELRSTAEDKPILNWLFDRYHWASQWRFVARCTWNSYGTQSYETNRVWAPTAEGKALYQYVKITTQKIDTSKELSIPLPMWEAEEAYRLKPEPGLAPNRVTFKPLYPKGILGGDYSKITSVESSVYKKALRIEINPTTLELVSAYVVSTETGEPV